MARTTRRIIRPVTIIRTEMYAKGDSARPQGLSSPEQAFRRESSGSAEVRRPGSRRAAGSGRRTENTIRAQGLQRFEDRWWTLSVRFRSDDRHSPVYTATRKTGNFFGGAGGPYRHRQQLTQDLHVGTLHVRLVQTDPVTASRWLSEDLLAPERRGEKLPDAVIRDEQGRDRLVIEFAGAYGANHVDRVHQDCVKRSLPYKLW